MMVLLLLMIVMKSLISFDFLSSIDFISGKLDGVLLGGNVYLVIFLLEPKSGFEVAVLLVLCSLVRSLSLLALLAETAIVYLEVLASVVDPGVVEVLFLEVLLVDGLDPLELLAVEALQAVLADVADFLGFLHVLVEAHAL